ncbi:MAG: CAP domain-containing protein [Patescibacteria group bacterium]
MRFNLKKYFIPHEGNDFKPHSLRTGSAVFVLALILVVEACFFLQSLYIRKTSFFASILQNVLVSETNGSRQSSNLFSLKESGLLNVAAKMKAEDMASKGYFAHVSPDGVDPWYWINKAGYKYSYAGENLAINFSDSDDVIKAWLNSPAHRDNILNAHFTEIGIGIAKGMYEGKETVFIAQMFGKPVKSQVSVPPRSFPSVTVSGEEPASVKNIATSVVPDDNSRPVVLGETSPVSLLVWTAATSPKIVSNNLYAFLMIIIAIALLLNVAIRPRIQHPRLVLNGVSLLVILNAFLILNNYLAFVNARIF